MEQRHGRNEGRALDVLGLSGYDDLVISTYYHPNTIILQRMVILRTIEIKHIVVHRPERSPYTLVSVDWGPHPLILVHRAEVSPTQTGFHRLVFLAHWLPQSRSLYQSLDHDSAA